MAVDTPTDGQIAAYQASSGEFEWVDDSSGSPGGTSGSIQYNDGAGGFAGSTKMLYDDTDAKITLSTGGNTLYIDAGGSPNFVMDGTGTGNIPWIIGDGGEVGGTGLLISGQNNVGNQQIWFNKGANQLQIKAPSSSESILINSDQGGDISITATNGSQDVLISAATGNVKIEGLTYPSSDGTPDQILKTNGSGVLSFTDAPSTSPGGSDGDFQINNSGAFGGTIVSTNKTNTITINSGASGDPQLQMTSNTKSITLTVDTNNKLKVEGALYSWELDASSATGGITFPDGSTQNTAASGGGTYQAWSGIKPNKANSSTYTQNNLMQFPYGFYTNDTINKTWSQARGIYLPFVLPSDQTITDLIIDLNSASASSSINFEVGIYDSDSDGYCQTQLVKATFPVGSGTATGVQTVAVTNTGGTGALTGGTVYWIGMCYVNDPSSNWAQFEAMDNATGAAGGIFATNAALSAFTMNAMAIRDIGTYTTFTLPTSVSITNVSTWQPYNNDIVAIGCEFA